jgi:hypothetical protein
MELESPPIGVGLSTVTGINPVVVRLEAGTSAFNCVEDKNVVANAVPFHRTTEAETKLLPVAIKLPPNTDT